MSRNSQNKRQTSRKLHNWGPAAALGIAVVAVLGLLAYSVGRTSAPTRSDAAEVAAAPVSSSSELSSKSPSVQKIESKIAKALPAPTRTVARPAMSTTIPVAGQQPTTPLIADRAKLIQAQLEAGEFGPAVETARSANDAGERTSLLKMVADAQARNGDFHAAEMSIRHMPIPETRDLARAENSARRTAAGGGANPAMLINLITKVTGSLDDWKTESDEQPRTPQYWAPGIEVAPNGLLRAITKPEKSAVLSSLGHRAREADLNTNLRAQSALRLVSLTRLEKEVAKCVAEGHSVPETMQRLAGLSQVRYVFVYPEEHEVIIGGPAEGWKYNENGLAVGREGGRPTLYLDDLVTVLRTFSPRGEGYFNCQIVPREEGLQKIKEFVEQSNARGPLTPGEMRTWTKQLQQALGLQDVKYVGIPDDSRVAQVTFEADYRLKLIGIGKLQGGPGIPSYFDLLPKTGAVKSQDMDALRWWLSMKYDAVTHSPDRNVFEIQGSAVTCQSENEKISGQGQRIHTGKAEVTNRLFAANFTQHYPELAAQDLVFADLQNVFDLSLVAALLTDNRIADRLGWNLGAFGKDGVYQTAHYQPTKTILSVVNHRVYNDKDVVVQVAGGVEGHVRDVLKDPKVFRESTKLAGLQAKGRARQLPEGRWWWDVKSK